MGNRLELHDKLVAILPHAYFQPPENLKLTYPCIVYEKASINVKYADNTVYRKKTKYTVTVICKDPDNTYGDSVMLLPYVSFDRRFVSDNLYHDVYSIYY